MNSKKYTLLTDIQNIKNSSVKINYICLCKNEFSRPFKDIKKDKQCRKCRTYNFNSIPKTELIEENGEIWKPIQGGWISNFGNAKNIENKIIKITENGRYHFNNKFYSAARLVAQVFQIENYDKLSEHNYIVSHIDNNVTNNNISNLKIITRSELSKNIKERTFYFKN
jgi:hypothetical protein